MENIWIRKNRLEIWISQFKLAKVLGITSHMLSSWELGKTFPNKEQKELIESFFSYPDAFLLQAWVTKKKRIINKIGGSRGYKKGKVVSPKKLIQFYKEIQPPKIKINSELKAIMLFSGIGWMSLGFKQAGFNIVWHAEINQSAEKIYQLNFPESRLIGKDIRDISNEQALALKQEHWEITVMAGWPPCQWFSLAWKRNIFDPRNELFKDFARLAKIIQPKFIVLENVKTLLTMRTKDGGFVKDYLIEAFSEAWYILRYKILNTKDYWVPQSRTRVVFLGIRKDLSKIFDIEFPKETHGEWRIPYKTFRSATKDLDILESWERSSIDPWHFSVTHPQHIINMLKWVPEWRSAHENPNLSLRPTSGYNTTYKRITWDDPSSTISTNFSMISWSRNVHPENTRSLTIREALRCQSFPDYFKLDWSLGEIRTWIGNAVPPELAKTLAMLIKSILLGDKNNLT